MTKFWGSVAMLALTGCSYDPGGSIADRINLVEQEYRVIQDYEVCASSCPMHLHNGCTEDLAVFIFHGPSYNGQPMNEEDFEKWSRVLAEYYGEGLGEWYMEIGRYGQNSLFGYQIIQMQPESEC